jgi:hypothetical protein
MNCINLAQNRDKWRALVNMEMQFRVPQNDVKFLSGFETGGPSNASSRQSLPVTEVG